MWRLFFVLFFICAVLTTSCGQEMSISRDEVEDHISPEDLKIFLDVYNRTDLDVESRFGNTDEDSVPKTVDCFGLGSFITNLPWIFNLTPDSSEKINTHFFFSSRDRPDRVLVQMEKPGQPLNFSSVDFKPSRRTVVIIHGFMSFSNSSWVHEMTRAFLQWADVNVIAVDWSNGGNTWKYWRAVANTRRVGSDVTNFFLQLKLVIGADFKDFHLIGHSLGAHISSFVSHLLGGVARITGLDPAQPCFRTENVDERLDESDADFVDVIHTNGRLLKRIGFGLPEQIGHADFYPNGGMRQPGCRNKTNSVLSKLIPFYSRLQQAICSHGRSYLLFTESLINNKCSFKAQRWNLTVEGLDLGLLKTCRRGNCSEMGIRAEGGKGSTRASGPYFTLTTDKEPYCSTEREVRRFWPDLLRDLRRGFQIGLTSIGQSDDSGSSATSLSNLFSKWTVNLVILRVIYQAM